jgi:RNA polymerase sigma-70 factor (ECF subfamily)
MELALLTAIQRLPGRQRAVLILRDVLGWSGAETADLLDTTVAAVNSALQRARATIEHEVPARSVAPGRATERALLARYVDAWETADVDGLVALLREDAQLSMPPQATIVGGAAVGAFFGRQRAAHRLRARGIWVNGRPALALTEPGADGTAQPHRLLVLDADADGALVQTVHAYRADVARVALAATA